MKTIFNAAAATLCAFILQTPAVIAQNKPAKADSLKTSQKTISRKVVTPDGKKRMQTVTINGMVETNGDTTKLKNTLGNSVIILNNGTRYVLKNNDEIKIEINGDSIKFNGEASLYNNPNIIITEPKDIRNGAINSLRDMNFMLNIPDIVNIFNGHVILGVATEKAANGVKIVGVTKGSAAEKAGLKVEDIIQSINKVKIASPEDLQKEITSYNAGNTIEVGYIRNNKQLSTKAVLQENKDKSFRYYNTPPSTPNSNSMVYDLLRRDARNKPGNNGSNLELLPRIIELGDSYTRGQKWGITAQETEENNGVLVLEVEKGSLAEKAGIQKNDILTSYKEQAIGSLLNLSQLMQLSKPGETVKIGLNRKGKIIQAEVKIPVILKTMQL